MKGTMWVAVLYLLISVLCGRVSAQSDMLDFHLYPNGEVIIQHENGHVITGTIPNEDDPITKGILFGSGWASRADYVENPCTKDTPAEQECVPLFWYVVERCVISHTWEEHVAEDGEVTYTNFWCDGIRRDFKTGRCFEGFVSWGGLLIRTSKRKYIWLRPSGVLTVVEETGNGQYEARLALGGIHNIRGQMENSNFSLISPEEDEKEIANISMFLCQ